MRRRRRKRAAELTPLLDVLFILLFASLVHSRNAAEQGARAAAPAEPDAGPDAGPRAGADAGPPDAMPADAAIPDAQPAAAHAHRAHARRIATLVAGGVRSRDVHVIEVSSAGFVVERARWRDGVVTRRERLHHRLLRQVPPEESDVELEYRGNVHAAHRLCRIALASADPEVPDLDLDMDTDTDMNTDLDPAQALVVITADAPLVALPRALRDGLLRDAGRCFDDARGIAIVIDPRKEEYELE